jgi:hypothetical protein
MSRSTGHDTFSFPRCVGISLESVVPDPFVIGIFIVMSVP